jgi:hypothetical protein
MSTRSRLSYCQSRYQHDRQSSQPSYATDRSVAPKQSSNRSSSQSVYAACHYNTETDDILFDIQHVYDDKQLAIEQTTIMAEGMIYDRVRHSVFKLDQLLAELELAKQRYDILVSSRPATDEVLIEDKMEIQDLENKIEWDRKYIEEYTVPKTYEGVVTRENPDGFLSENQYPGHIKPHNVIFVAGRDPIYSLVIKTQFN